MDSSSYERKWIRLREYLPFLRKMIDKLEGRKGSSAELSKVKSLHRVLSSPLNSEGLPAPFLRMETLLKCEEILKALYEQVEGPILESPKSPPPASRYPAFHFQNHHHHRQPPRIIPLERRSGGLEFTHQAKTGNSPLTYGEYRKLKQQQPPCSLPDPIPTHYQHQHEHQHENKVLPLPRPSPPASPDAEPTSPIPPTPLPPTPPLKENHVIEEEEDLSDSESESLQIDEQLPTPVKKEIKEEEVADSIVSPASPEITSEDQAMDVQEEVAVIKREVKPENKTVFSASDENDKPFDPEFSLKKVHFSPSRVDELKSSSENLKQVYDKLRNVSHKRPARVRLKVTEVKERKTNTLPDNDNLILTEQPESYSNKMSDIINRLKITVVEEDEAKKPIDQENEESLSEESTISDLLPLIKDFKKDIQPIPSTTSTADDYGLKKVKTKDNIKYILPLFKCWISSCQYASDQLDDYRSHLIQEKVSTYHCVYCQKDFEVLDEFLDHLIYSHGRCPYQCPYCEFRSTSKLSILIHQQHLHPEQNKCYYSCKYLSEESDTPRKMDRVSCGACDAFSSQDVSGLLNHMNKEHPDRINSLQFYCYTCQTSFAKVIELLLHHTFKHGQDPFHVGILEIEKMENTGAKTSAVEFTCGYEHCQDSFQSLDVFTNHMKERHQSSAEDAIIDCCFCELGFKTQESLLDHIRSHSQFRFTCALCSYRDLTSGSVFKHMKKCHGVDKGVLHPRFPDMNDKDSDPFLIIPEKAFKRSEMLKCKKDIYSPDQMCDIPRISMFKSPIHCSECDFVTKVRMNFIKHMKLHKKSSQTGAITPINPPPCVDGRNFKSMGVNNEEDDKVLREDEIAALPAFVPENQRFSCCSPNCNYITIDEVMLIYHINTLHPKCKDFYSCPHCTEVKVDYEDLAFHIKCHGDLLFKCTYCPYFHWQKRTAQQHVIETHKDIRGHIRDVRKDTEIRRAMDSMKVKKVKEEESKEVTPELKYFPYHCGLCDNSYESLDETKEHIDKMHGLKKQFHCSVGDFSSDDRVSFKSHLSSNHGDNFSLGIQTFYIEQVKSDIDKKSHAPLWSRNMIRVRHIRGILFDDDKAKKLTPIVNTPKAEEAPLSSSTSNDIPYPYKAQCIKCGVIKKSIKNLKTHIQAVHLKSTKASCSYCSYTAGTVKSVKIHHKKCHPDQTFQTNMELQETAKFDHEYWKSTWKIPKPHERKRLGYEISTQSLEPKKNPVFSCKHCKYTCSSLKGLKTHNTKSHPNSKLELASESNEVIDLEYENDPATSISGSQGEVKNLPNPSSNAGNMPQGNNVGALESLGKIRIPKKTKDILTAAQEISPFEHVPTFKCLYCPKRTQSLIRIERHLSSDHPNHTSGHRMLTRDQVVEMITDCGPNSQDSQDYSCYFCDKGGDILELQDHFFKSHPDHSLKVKKKVRMSSYLECQICGYLTPGFDRSQQKVHYHDEHPLEENIVAHKYVLKRKNGGPQGSNDGNDKKFDFNKFAGESIHCPKTNCDFECKTISAIMAHLRKHTQTFKCGHCGTTFVQSSAFNNHSAMMHGDKIPDLVKDMEAEAEFEALKGLLEAYLCKSSKC